MLKYISFYRKNRDCYRGTEDVASLAVLRSYPSLTYHNLRVQLSAILVEQALIQARVPFIWFLTSTWNISPYLYVKSSFFPILNAFPTRNSPQFAAL